MQNARYDARETNLCESKDMSLDRLDVELLVFIEEQDSGDIDTGRWRSAVRHFDCEEHKLRGGRY